MRLETGMVLILVLILLMVSSLLLGQLVLQSYLGHKMAYNFYSEMKAETEEENRLLKLE